MKEVSNRLIAGLLALAIVVSLTGTLVSLNKLGELKWGITGMATNTTTGAANLSVSGRTELVNRNLTLDWGTGYVNSTADSCNLSTTDTSYDWGCINFSLVTEGFLLENAGNYNLSVNYSASKNAADFIGGESPSPEFQINVTPNVYKSHSGDSLTDTVAACNGSTNITTWTDITTEGSWICGGILNQSGTTYSGYDLDMANNKDALAVDLRIVIPSTAGAGAKTVSLTFGAVSSG